jgi:precorrin-2/cobalt-factor-2 C20-methyltransferase
MYPGELIGIGVGPGDPKLITLAAVQALGRCTHVFAAASSSAEDSIALSIARPHLPPDTPVTLLRFPMTTQESALQAAWQENAHQVATAVRQGERCAFLTLGDPLLYSTFGYLLRTLLAQDPQFPVRVIPGITSFQAAAARMRVPLAEGRERLLILPAVRGAQEVTSALAATESLVILKAGKRFAQIHKALTAAGAAERSHLATAVGLPGEHISLELPQDGAPRPYLTLVLVPSAERTAPPPKAADPEPQP